MFFSELSSFSSLVLAANHAPLGNALDLSDAFGMDEINSFMPMAGEFMCLIFFVIFPSALALYSVANGAFSLFQQRLLYKRLGAE